MKQRLIRALQRGGVVAQIEPDRWGVWRGRDRRGRVIGTLSGAEIDVLRVRESLKPLGDGTPPIFVWSTSVLETPLATPSADRLETEPRIVAGPLIELMISRAHDTDLRELIRDTARRYRADAERAAGAGTVRGMNWDGLALGGKVDGGVGYAELGTRRGRRSGDKVQQTLRKCLDGETLELLDRLILSGDTRVQLVKRFGGRPALMERRAMAAVRDLHQTYRTKFRTID